jgi:RNA polymerase sigma factor (sigma-70 family)
MQEVPMLIPLLMRERSIDDFVDKDENCRLGALLADRGTVNQEEKLYLKEIRGLVREALILLDERERHIISNRFGLLGGKELTLEEIGKTLNLSRERVRQLEREAKEKLRDALLQIRSNVRYSLA